MLSGLRTKIRALIEDYSKSDSETFIYENATALPLSESNISSVTRVLINDSTQGSGDYSYSAVYNEITITASLSDEDVIKVEYSYNKYSDTELNEYIRASLVWMGIFSYSSENYELETTAIAPTPDLHTINLIAIVSAILINPDYTRYSLPNVTVVYHNKLTKEDKIETLINKFKYSMGVNGVLIFDLY
jgi:hypothetical protein